MSLVRSKRSEAPQVGHGLEIRNFRARASPVYFSASAGTVGAPSVVLPLIALLPKLRILPPEID
jgi:hypothetical protein